MRAPEFLPIDFIVVGGGIAGFTAAIGLARAGHHVTLLDEGSEETLLSGGCRLPPSNSKIFYRWGMEDRLKKISISTTKTCFMSYKTGDIIGGHELDQETVEEVGGEYLLINYADLRALLIAVAREVGTDIRMNSKVVSVSVARERSSVTISSGEVLTADVVVGCDGCAGLTRSLLIGAGERIAYVGKAFTAVLVDDTEVEKDSELQYFLDQKDQMSMWAGSDRGAMSFPIPEGVRCLTYWGPQDNPPPDNTPVRPFSPSQEEVDAAFIGAESRLRKMAKLATFRVSLPVTEQPHLDEWIHPDGPLIVIGEGAHPLPPASLYATTMATGDGFVLGRMFSHLARKDQIPFLLSAVQEIRQARLETVLSIARANPFALSMPPGADKALDESAAAKGMEGHDMELLQEILEKIFLHDSEDEVDAWWLHWGMMANRDSSSGFYNIQIQTEKRLGSPSSF